MTGNANTLDPASAFIKALKEPAAYDHDIDPVRIVETHISWVLLTGRYAYKIKKPVKFGFLDFSTLEKRRFFCHEELRLNRRLAADLYLAVVPITGTPDRPKFDGTGPAIEYAVKMLQFPGGQLLDERAATGCFGLDEIEPIAAIVADFHEHATQADEGSPYGDAADIKHWFDENFTQIRPLLEQESYRQRLQAIQDWSDAEGSAKSTLFQFRQQQGFVRECHGDLHLSNITLINGNAMLFDCIEFNPQLRWIDVISEVAFLMIDLLYFGCESHAHRFVNRYLQHTGDYQGLGVLHYYLVYRALVLAKIALLRMQQCQGDDYLEAQARFEAFFKLAERFTRHTPAELMITHGYSGSGKSTFAARLADQCGVFQLRSDIERKRLYGFRAGDASGSAVGDGIYTREAEQQTYRRLVELAGHVVRAGFSVIIDATFLKVWQRDLFRQLAVELAARFVIVDFQVPEAELLKRIKQRSGDASEATADVLRLQQQTAEPLSEEDLKNVHHVQLELLR